MWCGGPDPADPDSKKPTSAANRWTEPNQIAGGSRTVGENRPGNQQAKENGNCKSGHEEQSHQQPVRRQIAQNHGKRKN